MKYIATLPSLVAALCLVVPATGFSKDKDDHRHYSDHGHHSYYHGHGSYWSRPSIGIYRSYPSYYRSYPYEYGAYPYYYGPSFGLSFSTTPTYYGESTYYRGIPRSTDYGDDLAVDVQRALARRGYYHGAIDGDVGTGTRSAIRQYQYDRRLEVTGRIDRSLLHSLGLD